MLDTDLAEALGYAVPRDIRKLIKRHAETLVTLGATCATVAQVRGQDATVYHLNKPQALFIITKAETSKAVEVTVDMIEKFVAYEAGLLQPKAALPDFSNPVLAARAWADELEGRMLAQAEAKVLAAEVEGENLRIVPAMREHLQPLDFFIVALRPLPGAGAGISVVQREQDITHDGRCYHPQNRVVPEAHSPKRRTNPQRRNQSEH